MLALFIQPSSHVPGSGVTLLTREWGAKRSASTRGTSTRRRRPAQNRNANVGSDSVAQVYVQAVAYATLHA